MTLRLVPLLLAVLMLAACNKPQTPAPVTPTAAAVAAPVTATAAAPGAAATPPAASPGGPITAPAGPAPVAGSDFVEIAGGQPFQPVSDRIEVAEVFGYTCPHCAEFEPLVGAWKAKLPADVQFTLIAAPFGGYWMPYAKAFYTAEAMGLVDRSHDAMFRAIHIDHSLPVQPLPAPEQIAAFYAQYGANPQQFVSTMASFTVDAKLKRAEQFLTRSGVDSTPTLVVDGKYRVVGKSFEDSLRIADHLVARVRASRAGVATPATGG